MAARVVGRDEAVDALYELFDAGERSKPNRLVGDQRERALDLVQLRTAGDDWHAAGLNFLGIKAASLCQMVIGSYHFRSACVAGAPGWRGGNRPPGSGCVCRSPLLLALVRGVANSWRVKWVTVDARAF